MVEIKERDKILEGVMGSEKANLDAYAVGTVCLLESDLGRPAPDGSGNIEILKNGSPVKIVGCDRVVLMNETEEDCLDVSITVEDHRGELWTIDNVHASSLDLLFTKLEPKDIDWLLSDKGHRHFKYHEWTDGGYLSTYRGPCTLIMAALSGLFAVGCSEGELLLSTFAVLLSVILSIFGIVDLVIGYTAYENPLSDSEEAFFKNHKEAKQELKALITEKE